jgi:hypothetical protein
MNYWENKKINITYAINKVKNYYQKFILYSGIFLVLFIISSLLLFFAMNYVDIIVVSIPFFNIIQLVLSFVLFLVPSILIVKNISLKKSLKESWITVRANLTNSIYIFLIGTLASLIVLSPAIIVANLQLMTGKVYSLPVWADPIMYILLTFSFMFNISLIMGYYLRIYKKR